MLLLLSPAPPARLRAVVLEMLKLDPALCALDRPTEVWSLAPGSLALIRVSAVELEWLNRSRPVFADRGLRVVLWPADDLPTGIAFREKAPDLYDWITAKIELPQASPSFAVAGLRASRGYQPGVAWRGGMLDPCLAEAGLGEASRLSAQDPFEVLVKALRGLVAPVVVWTDTDGRLDLWRVRWAVAESGYAGLSVLAAPPRETPGWWPVHGRVLDWREGAEALRRAGAPDGALLAAILDGEPEAVARVAARIQAGEAESELIAGCGQVEDPGAWLAAREEDADAPALRAHPEEARARLPDEPDGLDRLGARVEVGLRSAAPDTLGLALDAQVVGEHEAALWWAGRALAEAGEDAERAVGALVVRWTSLKILGAVGDELQTLAQVRERLLRVDPTLWADPRALGLGAIVLAEGSDPAAARLLIDSALQRAQGEAHPEHIPTLVRLARVQELAGDGIGACMTLERAVRAAGARLAPRDPERAYGLYLLALAQHRVGAAAQAKASAEAALDLYRALRGADDATDGLQWWMGGCHQIISAANLDLGDPAGARVASRAAIDALHRLGGRRQDLGDLLAGALHNLGASLRAQGDLQGAQEALDEATRLHRGLAARWPTLYLAALGLTLAMRAEVLAARGEARAALVASQEAVDVLRRAPNAGREDLAFALQYLALAHAGFGDIQHALAPMREAIGILRELAPRASNRHRAALAECLDWLGSWLHGRDDAESLACDQEALTHYQAAVPRLGGGDLAVVAKRLANLGGRLLVLESPEAALIASALEVEALRRLVAPGPAETGLRLVEALIRRAALLAAQGYAAEAARVADDAATAATSEIERHLRHSLDALRRLTRILELSVELSPLAPAQQVVSQPPPRGEERPLPASTPEAAKEFVVLALMLLGTTDHRGWTVHLLRVAAAAYRERDVEAPGTHRRELIGVLLLLGSMLPFERAPEAARALEEALHLQLQPAEASSDEGRSSLSQMRDQYISRCGAASMTPDRELLDRLERALNGASDLPPEQETGDPIPHP